MLYVLISFSAFSSTLTVFYDVLMSILGGSRRFLYMSKRRSMDLDTQTTTLKESPSRFEFHRDRDPFTVRTSHSRFGTFIVFLYRLLLRAWLGIDQ